MGDLLWEADARTYSISETLSGFVPNLVWDTVRYPRHQLLYGGIGTGKTILLKRLSWPAMLEKADFLEGAQFIAFYCDMRDMEDLHSLFSERMIGSDPRIPQYRLGIASYLGTLHLICSLARTIRDTSESGSSCEKSNLRALLTTSNRVLGPISSGKFSKVGEVVAFTEEKVKDLISAIGKAAFADRMETFAKTLPPPEQTLRIFAHEFSQSTSMRLGFLLDQYDWVHPDCQIIFNPLLKRENANFFFTIVASRPFAFNPRLETGYVQPGEDFSFTVVEYFPDEHIGYRKLLMDVWKQRLPREPSIEQLLGAEGFQFFATLSSRSVRQFIDLCKQAIILSSRDWRQGLKKELQGAAARTISNLTRDRFKSIAELPLEMVWGLLLFICNKAKQSADDQPTLPDLIQVHSPDLLGMDGLCPDAINLVKKAFEEGALQFVTREDAHSLSIPDRFSLSPLISPVLKAQVKKGFTISIERAEIDKVSKERPHMMRSAPSLAPITLRSAFLSISFQSLPEPRMSKELFHEVFRDADINVVTGEAVGTAMLTQLLDQIINTDLTILELSHLRPNIILEMGLTIGVDHRLVPVLLKERSESVDLSLYPFLSDMGRITYSLTKQGVRDLREKAVEWARKSMSRAHLLYTTLDGSTRLRVTQTADTVCIYFPEERKTLWSNFVDHLEDIAESAGQKLYIINLKPHRRGLSLFDNLVWCICKSQCMIVDTSGPNEPDLYGAFALGFGFALAHQGIRKRILRIEEKGKNHKQALSMWPQEHYRNWDTPANLQSLLHEFLAPQGGGT